MNCFEALRANEPELAALRAPIRDFLRTDRDKFPWELAVDSWLGHWGEGFRARLGDAGFLRLTIPTGYGGRGLG